jgi:hypothetical protein
VDRSAVTAGRFRFSQKVKVVASQLISEDGCMLLLILACLAIAALLLLGRHERRQRPVDALGTISEGWIASHRSSPYDTHR